MQVQVSGSVLKTFRLDRVKRQLREADDEDLLVKQIADANGFHHLGQFCRDYRQLFGESPSESLHRK
ncbi:helix-turn-helix domain-containing protein [Thalassoglobus polymorphus]|uniref:helix-turn-helix domain-containing protein n=1 Tax=Thalassoglobus polymorphus TaxID=2527994 RepID=UPI0018D22968|nr:helix-turn-helix domain-containing protein [Thalassoglobus polymorphus]